MKSFHMFALLVLLIVGANAAPQFWPRDEDLTKTFISGRPIENRVSTTTAAPTTASPRVRACIQSCPATSEYNPICGSDNVNYFNEGRFNCAVGCGQNVRRLHLGICSTT
ncbi:uncharacterized protein LOC117787829 [Drosophila innubila]|uniref:uncharacterized protein LOC117787829 n=1 Tax=Drosophila innubila TaxID=198719 RepID=UPI00148D82E7|nr:uncharacterized protein LOC117787829 [Drosophila innubila]